MRLDRASLLANSDQIFVNRLLAKLIYLVTEKVSTRFIEQCNSGVNTLYPNSNIQQTSGFITAKYTIYKHCNGIIKNNNQQRWVVRLRYQNSYIQ